MEENNRKGTGVFYAVVGVATLVVAIVGATFAYFSASQSNTNTVKGEAATAGLTLSVEPIVATTESNNASDKLIPLQDGTASAPFDKNHIESALNGDVSRICLDDMGNTVCKLYKITVKNEGSTVIQLNGTLNLTATGYSNLKWVNFSGQEGSRGFGTGENGTSYDECVFSSADISYPSSFAKCHNAAIKNASDSSIISDDPYSAGEEKMYFILIYIAETGTPQDTTDKGSFTGVVTFNAANGQGVTSTFGSN